MGIETAIIGGALFGGMFGNGGIGYRALRRVLPAVAPPVQPPAEQRAPDRAVTRAVTRRRTAQAGAGDGTASTLLTGAMGAPATSSMLGRSMLLGQ